MTEAGGVAMRRPQPHPWGPDLSGPFLAGPCRYSSAVAAIAWPLPPALAR